ncbi:MAG: competence/damage-inducible protein A [Candidatus Omnitrophica bacterium]|nr:competence/damage-inducible protein A [Candidatus Omnitrophota bacterium]MCM8803002.1 competence/damage-inducible protein A [Candidatus Omnitrophota bacterium]
MRIEVINIGTELLFGRVNTNLNLISGILLRSGFKITKCVVVGDNKEEIKQVFLDSYKNSDIIIITGGLGPTFDDITRESIAESLNRKLIFDEKIWEEIKEKFKRRNIEPPEITRRQAYIIEGSKEIVNENGTAPGMLIEENGKLILILPGPPNELKPMLENSIKYIEEKFERENIITNIFSIIGVPESEVETRIRTLIEQNKKNLTILAHPNLIELVLTLKENEKEKFVEFENELREKFGLNYLGMNIGSVPELIGKLLKERKLRLAIAESCSGGLACKLITDIPGSSEYFIGGFVTYSNVLKKKILKIPKTILRKFGAVSEQTAIYMAKNAKKYGKADISVSFTGIAGPTGATPEKPVGLIWIGVCYKKDLFAENFIFSGDRQTIRERAVYKGFELLREVILKYEKK